MAKIFGVDSAMPANTRLTNGYYLHSWITRMNCFPAFWGRSLTGEDMLTVEEAEFLHGKNCKAALIFNELSENDVSEADGSDDAMRAAEAAKALGVPQNAGIAIFAAIGSDWSISHNWMISFAHTLFENGFVPGFIGNTDSSKNFNFDRQYGHFVHATDDRENYGAVVWATEPKTEEIPGDWSPYCPSVSVPEQIGLWQTGTTTYREKTVNVSYARDESILGYMW